jgi:hypothetical protein
LQNQSTQFQTPESPAGGLEKKRSILFSLIFFQEIKLRKKKIPGQARHDIAP